MTTPRALCCCLLAAALFASAVALPAETTNERAEDPFALPAGLLIGAGTSALQTEGAWDEDGKAESMADHLLHTGGLGSLGFGDPHQHDVAADSYHRYREDVAAAHRLKLKMFRFSLSWSRLLPTADASAPNEKGVEYYNNLINEILKYNITPVVTLYHFDHPQILEDRFMGWQGEEMPVKFEEFARFAFRRFGDRVKLWTTINEPNMYCTYFPQLFVLSGLYTAEQQDLYRCVRHTILAHARAYRAFKADGHDGRVGFTALVMHARPNSTRPEDVYAAQAFNLMHAGIALHPVVHGDYPQLVKQLAGKKLPPFSDEEKKLIKGSSDFLGFNVYYMMVAEYIDPNVPNESTKIPVMGKFLDDLPFVKISIDGLDPQHLFSIMSMIVPDALRDAVVWAWETYSLPILIAENGMSDWFGKQGLHDHNRAAYHSAFLRALVTTINEFKVDVIGYAAWSLIDSFEWSGGYQRPFGLVHVDYAGGSLNRTLKDSASFWTELAETGVVPLVLEKRDDDAPSGSGSLAGPSAGWVLLLMLLAALRSS